MNKSGSSGLRRLTSAFATVALIALVAIPAHAQDTSSEIRGRILDASGQPVSGANVVVEDTRTGVSRGYISNSSGTFLATRLPVGGPYVVTINNVKTVDVPSISLGDTYNLVINLQQAEAIEEIVTIGQSADMIDTAPGPSAVFDLAELNSAVGFNRDIKDVYSIDPRLNLDGFQVNCAGKHPRFNSITLDGVSTNDRFGLNTNGYSTATGQPFPFDAIQQVAVELAPFDVTYGGFSACNVNAVTKSGGNEFFGNVFYEFSDESLINDELDGADFSSQPYEKTKQGVSIGGPILKDRLFFFAAYEETESPQFLAAGPAGSGNGAERPWLSQADADRIRTIAQNVYGYDVGGLPQNTPSPEEKILARIDWNINDIHNLTGIYNYYDGSNTRCSDSDPEEFEFSNHCYVKGAELTTNTVILDSQWTDAFSTQVFFSNNKMVDSQVTVGPKDFGDHQINLNGRDNTVYIGADDSRQANGLNYKSDFIKLTGQFLAGDHVITAGYEKEDLSIFNIFVQHSRGGEWDYRDSSENNPAFCAALDAAGRFADANCGLSGIDKFELGRPDLVFYGSGGGTNIAADAAATFTNTQNSLYVQDELYLDDMDLSIVFGLRYEWFETDDRPVFNSLATSVLGIRNDANIDGVDILMPRLGFTWGVTPDIDLRGGVGLYSGGNPNVWISNAFSNDGVTNVQPVLAPFGSGSVLDGTIPLAGGQRPGYDVPQELFDIVANADFDMGFTNRLSIVDPNYKQPGEWKFALGGTWRTPYWGINVEGDLMYSRIDDPAIFYDISQELVGQTSNGIPIYDFTRGQDNFMLSNSLESGRAVVASVVVDKFFEFGLDLRLGYAYTDAKDVGPMTSFTSQSSWENLATLDPNNPSAGTSNYVTPHRMTLRAAFSRDFFGDNTTRITLMAYRQKGQPGTFTMGGSGLEGDGFFGRHLLYVPNGPSDPNVVYDPGFDQSAFNSFIAANGFGPGFIERNEVYAAWSNRLDLRVDQEIPLFVEDLKGRLYVKVYNFSNMINKDWGRQYDARFNSQQVVVSDVDAQGRLVYETFSARDITDLQEFASLWELRMGIEINFR